MRNTRCAVSAEPATIDTPPGCGKLPVPDRTAPAGPARRRTRRLCLAAVTGWAALVLPVSAAALSEADIDLYRDAFRAAEAGDWQAANAAVERAQDPVLADVILGRDLTREQAGHGFTEIAEFIDRRPGWPNTDLLRRRAERALATDGPDGSDAARVIAFFEGFAPLTGDGLLGLANALAAAGQSAVATRRVADRWPDIPLSESAQTALLARYGGALGDSEHTARLDRLLWEARSAEAGRMVPLVDAGWRALAEARRRLAERTGDVDGAIGAVPASLQDDEGLVYERLRWRRRADLTERAIELLDREPPGSAHGADWWRERHILARRLMEAGNFAGAYQVASAHRLSDGFPLAQAEWLSGWLALRFLDDASTALDHFQRLYASVETPISLARGAYWSGRALEALDDRPTAQGWYQVAAGHPTTFYGQLAADRLDLPTITQLPVTPSVEDAMRETFRVADGPRIVSALVSIGETDWADRFLIAMAEATDNDQQLALIGELAMAHGRQWAALRVAKTAARLGHILTEASYPVIPLDEADPRVEPALVLALIRQESEFRADAVSHAGARGLMQLMPQTAQSVALQLGVAHSTDRLTSETAHNIRLGSAYLADQIAELGGSYALAAAAYNAGPSRVRAWIEQNGDPRRAEVDMIDWIEAIPIYETRNYVQRVLEGVEVYRRRLGGPPTVDALERDLAR